MELVSIEQSRLISLFAATRPSGQLYLPDALAALAQRYSFVEVPTKIVGVETLEFKHGKFRDAAIEALNVYRDGVLITSRSNTKILENFLNDLLEWFGEKYSVVLIDTARVNKLFESSLVIDSSVDLLKIVRNVSKIGRLVSSKLEVTSGIKADFEALSVHLGPDLTKLPGDDMKPASFRVERRMGVPFEKNRFFSVAPLTTDDHLATLDFLEQLV